MEVAPRYTVLEYTVYNVYTVYTVSTVYTIQTALHCLNTSMFAYIQLLGKVRTLLEWANTLLNKKVEWMNGWYPLDCYDY